MSGFPGAGGGTAEQINDLLQVGDLSYGMIAISGGTYNGKDVPFAYNRATSTFETISIPGGAASLPTTPVAVGDWTPPTMSVVGSLIVITHPGFPGGTGPYFGWLDVSGFSSTTITGNTNGNKSITGLSTDVLQAGWTVGMNISDNFPDIPAGTTITNIPAGGLSITISNAATGSNMGVTFTVTGGTATAPLYNAGNTNGNALSSVPLAVNQFNGRAYYAVQAGVVFSDALNALQVTNASQALTFSNGINVTALAGLPVAQTTGGILQALICFQADAQMQQITGDPATTNLAVNALGVGVGTLAPNAICQTPDGLMFLSQDGLRIINIFAQVSEAVGSNGEGINVPFINSVYPTRSCAAYNEDVYRVSVTNGAASGSPRQEWWFHFKLKSWSGPHSFPSALIAAYDSVNGHGFTMVPWGTLAELWTSTTIPTVSDTYIENGTTLTYNYTTALTADNEALSMNACVQGTFACALPASQSITVTASDENGNILASTSIAGTGQVGALWGTAIWGEFLWGAGKAAYVQLPIYWAQPVVFKQSQITITGTSAPNVALGNLRLRLQQLDYLSNQMPPEVQIQ